MFKLQLVVLAALAAVAIASPQRRQYHAGGQVALVKELPSNNIGLDGYKYAYELSDGTKRDESAQVHTSRDVRTREISAILRVSGSFSWVNPSDGQVYTVKYVADENGFQPQGAHLPVA